MPERSPVLTKALMGQRVISMFHAFANIDLDQLDVKNRLFHDFVSSSVEQPPFLQTLPSGGKLWSHQRPRSLRTLDANQEVLWRELTESVAALSGRLGTHQRILDQIDRAGTREARFVITGQQPGALGGPLYAAYKIATAVALARLVERESDRPCIPLYWCGADDTDFQEIRDVSLITRQLSLVSSSISPHAHDTGMPVGDIGTDALRDMWGNLSGFVSELPGEAAVRNVVESAFSSAKDHGELCAAILIGALGGEFAVVDGRSPEVRRYAKSLFAEYTRQEVDVKQEVTKNGKRLENSGYHAQLKVGADSGVFIVENGRRRSVSADRLPVLADAVADRVETCSPGVILRNLVQDYTFEPLAVVLGPAEIAYRAQIATLYQRFDVERPVEFPRMAATFVPPPLVEILRAAEGLDVTQLVKEPAVFAKTIYRSQTPESVRDGVAEFTASVRGALERLCTVIEGAAPDRSRAKILAKLRELGDRSEQTAGVVLETGRIRSLERWPFLSDLSQVMRPGDRAQERRLSALVPFLHAAGQGGETLMGL
ncbi:MAG: bacillithiol biosynthesis BshC, partial [Candidatus Krumholzibacteria bacterium]|nr:bacillithiol biosynthesis BshC [Candidatus Krumholzibacteria bacterium]